MTVGRVVLVLARVARVVAPLSGVPQICATAWEASSSTGMRDGMALTEVRRVKREVEEVAHRDVKCHLISNGDSYLFRQCLAAEMAIVRDPGVRPGMVLAAGHSTPDP
jgi:hypothetical protein